MCWLWVALVWAMDLPLQTVSFAVRIRGPVAEILVRQTYANPSERAIEAVYVFPLHEAAAVDGMRIEVGDRVVDGIILEREEAAEAYRAAMRQGHVAAMTSQARANVFTQRVANLPPGEPITVQLRVVQPVGRPNGSYELVIPLAVGPRFVRSGGRSAVPGPAVALAGTEARATVRIDLDPLVPIVELESPSHEVAWTERGSARALAHQVALDRDFVLRWRVDQARIQAGAAVQSGHLLVTLEPPEAPPREHVVPRELIWVIDESCSMRGRSIELARAAVLRALEQVDERDTVQIVRFAQAVSGDPEPLVMLPEHLAAARGQVLRMRAKGGTYLLEGVLRALAVSPDPSRERFVILVTDGLIGDDPATLRRIAEQRGDARVFVFGVGAVPNRWFLTELARVGQGRIGWLRAGDDPREAVDRFADVVSRPLLSDLQIDWGDWDVRDVWPREPPMLYAGEPLSLTGRVFARGTTPIVVHGRLGDGPFRQVLQPRFDRGGRAIPSTWARQTIAGLERELRGRDDEPLAGAIRDLSLAYQVLSRFTAFLAVDRSRVVSDGEASPVYQPIDPPDGMLVREAVSTIPAGRSYQTAVSYAAGVETVTLHATVTGRADGLLHESTYLRDGVNVTDPVTGTFSVNFDMGSLREVSIVDAGGRMVDGVSRTGTNDLQGVVGVSRLAGLEAARGMQATAVDAELGGPWSRDRGWAYVSYGYDRTRFRGRVFDGHTGFAHLTMQPSSNHRLGLLGTVDAATIEEDGGGEVQGGWLSTARWQWFLGAAAALDTRLSAQRSIVAGTARAREQVLVHGTVAEASDPLGGSHDVGFGVEAERVRWRLSPEARAVFGGAIAPVSQLGRVSLSGEDQYRPVANLTVEVAARADLTLGRVHLGPRLGVSWDPWNDERTRLVIGAGRFYGHQGLPVLLVQPEAGLSRTDEAWVIAEREVVDDLVLSASGRIRARSRLPRIDGVRVRREVGQAEVRLRKVFSHRWQLWTTYRRTWLRDPTQPVVDAGVLEGFGHVVEGAVTWTLPLDPSPTTLSLSGALHADPLGTPLPASLQPRGPNAVRRQLRATVVQELDVRRGRLELEVSGEWVEPLQDPRDLPARLGVEPPLWDLPGWGGPRVRGAVRYRF